MVKVINWDISLNRSQAQSGVLPNKAKEYLVIDGKIEGLNGVTNSLSAVIPKKLAEPTSSIFV